MPRKAWELGREGWVVDLGELVRTCQVPLRTGPECLLPRGSRVPLSVQFPYALFPSPAVILLRKESTVSKIYIRDAKSNFTACILFEINKDKKYRVVRTKGRVI